MAAGMALRSLSLLVLVAVAPREGASFHSLRYFYTASSDPSQGLPYFVSVGYVDDQLISYYDSHSRWLKPRVSWMEKVGKDDPQYWDRNTQIVRGSEEVSRVDLETLRNRYNQSAGFHTWQVMYGCELRGDGSKGGFWQYGYDGRTFITFDKETLTWVALDPQAQITQRKWDAFLGYNQRNKAYLEEICIEWLERYLSYGNETLLRTETPKVTVSSKMEAEDGMETLVCRVDGFYPREIDATWTRDGEVWQQDTFHRSVAPNADGTYHYWLSIQIDPKERSHYRCHVEHDGLQHPLDMALKEPLVVTMSRTEMKDGMETHVCRLDGFYPGEIDASWRKDGEVWLQDTFHGSVARNADGTYHYWLSIRIDAEERDRYWCHVEHESLQRPLDVALKETLMVMMNRTEMKDGMETHVCHVDGFYPKEIDASWRKDGEIWLQNICHGSIARNEDRTYRYWLSIQINPKERDRYRCHVEHESLQHPLDVALKATSFDQEGNKSETKTKVSESNLGVNINGCAVVAFALACVAAGL